ncbi:MAG: response regulator [Chitinophagales bacterium]
MHTTKEIVFIVDDEPMHAQMMEDFLKTTYPQFEIMQFHTGEECNDNMDKNPGIIILDYHLDAKDKEARNGMEILEHIKRNYPDTEVIMISGQDKINIAVDCVKAGAFDYIVKNETSFVRTQNAIERLFKHRSVEKNLSRYKLINQILIWGLIIIVVVSFILYITGVID